jgi:hypothetical protein
MTLHYYCINNWISNYQRGKKKGVDILLTPKHYYACPKPGPGFPMPYFMIPVEFQLCAAKCRNTSRMYGLPNW